MRYVVTFDSQIADYKLLFIWLENNVEKIESKQEFIGTAIVFATNRQITTVRQHSTVIGVEPIGEYRIMKE